MKKAFSSTSHGSARQRKRLTLVSFIAAGLALGLLLLAFTYLFILKNLARQEAAHLSKGLVEAGAILKCELGDPGRGPDNFKPWHKAYYQLDANKAEAFALVQRLTQENGFELQQALPGNNGGLPVADIYLDDWYFDDSSKMNPYRSLTEGPVELAFELEDDETVELDCGTEHPITLYGDANRTAITLYVRLPRSK